MKHAREDYNRIQDPAGLILEDEPVFLLRAQDILSPYAIESWVTMAIARGVDSRMIVAAQRQANKMRDWHKKKVPDMPDREEV